MFLKLGFTAFGGPAAHIALMRDEVVTRRGWMTEGEFLDLLGATNLLPGPNSTQMAIHIGLRRAGLKGSVAAGVCFIAPAAAMILPLAWAYRTYGALPQTQAILYGVKPVIIAIVIFAIRGLARFALKNWWCAAIGVGAAGAALLGWDVLFLLFTAGACAAAIDWAATPGKKRQPVSSLARMFAIAAAMIMVPNALTRGMRPAGNGPRAYGAGALFSFFLKVGTTVYGGGYVLIAFLRDGLVKQWHWLTERQLLDAIAAGQITPGPLFTTATFIGYLVGGKSGGLIATVAIFLPSFRAGRGEWSIDSALAAVPDGGGVSRRRECGGAGVDGGGHGGTGKSGVDGCVHRGSGCCEPRIAIPVPDQFDLVDCRGRFLRIGEGVDMRFGNPGISSRQIHLN
jgi:chromate transporter